MSTSNDTSIPEGYKRCSKKQSCVHPTGSILPMASFSKNKKTKDGLCSECKECAKKRVAEHHATHTEERHIYSVEYYTQHREAKLQYQAQYAVQNKERYLNYQFEYTRKNKRKLIRYGVQYRATHRAEISVRDALYRQNHPDQVRAVKQRRLARQRGLPASFTKFDFRRAKIRFNYRCAYCGEGPKETDLHWLLHQDHFIPLSALDCPGTVPWNILPACQSCNFSKHNKNPYEWTCSRFGHRKAKSILERIRTYFNEVQK